MRGLLRVSRFDVLWVLAVCGDHGLAGDGCGVIVGKVGHFLDIVARDEFAPAFEDLDLVCCKHRYPQAQSRHQLFWHQAGPGHGLRSRQLPDCTVSLSLLGDLGKTRALA
jgi:hypothetical protein